MQMVFLVSLTLAPEKYQSRDHRGRVVIVKNVVRIPARPVLVSLRMSLNAVNVSVLATFAILTVVSPVAKIIKLILAGTFLAIPSVKYAR